MSTQTSSENPREQAIKRLSHLLRTTPFTMEFKVKKRPAGIKILYEVTQEEMDQLIKNQAKED